MWLNGILCLMLFSTVICSYVSIKQEEESIIGIYIGEGENFFHKTLFFIPLNHPFESQFYAAKNNSIEIHYIEQPNYLSSGKTEGTNLQISSIYFEITGDIVIQDSLLFEEIKMKLEKSTIQEQSDLTLPENCYSYFYINNPMFPIWFCSSLRKRDETKHQCMVDDPFGSHEIRTDLDCPDIFIRASNVSIVTSSLNTNGSITIKADKLSITESMLSASGDIFLEGDSVILKVVSLSYFNYNVTILGSSVSIRDLNLLGSSFDSFITSKNTTVQCAKGNTFSNIQFMATDGISFSGPCQFENRIDITATGSGEVVKFSDGVTFQNAIVSLDANSKGNTDSSYAMSVNRFIIKNSTLNVRAIGTSRCVSIASGLQVTEQSSVKFIVLPIPYLIETKLLTLGFYMNGTTTVSSASSVSIISTINQQTESIAYAAQMGGILSVDVGCNFELLGIVEKNAGKSHGVFLLGFRGSAQAESGIRITGSIENTEVTSSAIYCLNVNELQYVTLEGIVNNIPNSAVKFDKVDFCPECAGVVVHNSIIKGTVVNNINNGLNPVIGIDFAYVAMELVGSKVIITFNNSAEIPVANTIGVHISEIQTLQNVVICSNLHGSYSNSRGILLDSVNSGDLTLDSSIELCQTNCSAAQIENLKTIDLTPPVMNISIYGNVGGSCDNCYGVYFTDSRNLNVDNLSVLGDAPIAVHFDQNNWIGSKIQLNGTSLSMTSNIPFASVISNNMFQGSLAILCGSSISPSGLIVHDNQIMISENVQIIGTSQNNLGLLWFDNTMADSSSLIITASTITGESAVEFRSDGELVLAATTIDASGGTGTGITFNVPMLQIQNKPTQCFDIEAVSNESYGILINGSCTVSGSCSTNSGIIRGMSNCTGLQFQDSLYFVDTQNVSVLGSGCFGVVVEESVLLANSYDITISGSNSNLCTFTQNPTALLLQNGFELESSRVQFSGTLSGSSLGSTGITVRNDVRNSQSTVTIQSVVNSVSNIGILLDKVNLRNEVTEDFLISLISTETLTTGISIINSTLNHVTIQSEITSITNQTITGIKLNKAQINESVITNQITAPLDSTFTAPIIGLFISPNAQTTLNEVMINTSVSSSSDAKGIESQSSPIPFLFIDHQFIDCDFRVNLLHATSSCIGINLEHDFTMSNVKFNSQITPSLDHLSNDLIAISVQKDIQMTGFIDFTGSIENGACENCFGVRFQNLNTPNHNAKIVDITIFGTATLGYGVFIESSQLVVDTLSVEGFGNIGIYIQNLNGEVKNLNLRGNCSTEVNGKGIYWTADGSDLSVNRANLKGTSISEQGILIDYLPFTLFGETCFIEFNADGNKNFPDFECTHDFIMTGTPDGAGACQLRIYGRIQVTGFFNISGNMNDVTIADGGSVTDLCFQQEGTANLWKGLTMNSFSSNNIHLSIHTCGNFSSKTNIDLASSLIINCPLASNLSTCTFSGDSMEFNEFSGSPSNSVDVFLVSDEITFQNSVS